MQKKDASESVNKEQRSGWKLFLGGLLLLAAMALICFFMYPRQNREPVATGSASSGLTQHTESTETAMRQLLKRKLRPRSLFRRRPSRRRRWRRFKPPLAFCVSRRSMRVSFK